MSGPYLTPAKLGSLGLELILVFLKVPHLILTVAKDENYWNCSLSNVPKLGKIFYQGLSLEPGMLLITQTEVQRQQRPRMRKEVHLRQTMLCQEEASEEASRERVKDPRWLQKQVVLGGEPCKEKSE